MAVKEAKRYRPMVDCGYHWRTGEEIVSRTKQSDKDSCDINLIMRRYETTGAIDHINPRAPNWGEFHSVPDFHTAQNTILEAEEAFARLPASVRDRFGNDPAQMLAFLADDANREEAIELGLVRAPDPEPVPQKVEVVNPTPPKPKDGDKPSSGAAG